MVGSAINAELMVILVIPEYWAGNSSGKSFYSKVLDNGLPCDGDWLLMH